MGLRDEISADIAEAFDNDLADAITEFIGIRKADGDYNPSTGKVENNSITYTGRGVFSSYKLENIDSTLIQTKDKKLTVLQAEITLEPKVDDVINGLKVIAITTDPADVSYTIQLRS